MQLLHVINLIITIFTCGAWAPVLIICLAIDWAGKNKN
jgi:hypothetical protein